MSARDTARMIGQFAAAPLDAARTARLRAAIMKAPVPPPPPSGTAAPRGTRAGLKGGAAALGAAAVLIVGTALWLHQQAPVEKEAGKLGSWEAGSGRTNHAQSVASAFTTRSAWPTHVALRGTVHMPHGESASNVAVWVEEVKGPRLDNFVREFNTPTHAVAGTVVRTDGDGRFAIATVPTSNRFVVKAVPRMYPPALSDTLRQHTLPIDNIDITVSDFGGRIIGKLTGPDGTPVTNVYLGYGVFRHMETIGESVEIAVDVEPDGQYITQVLRPGWHTLYYDTEDRDVLIRNGATETVDVQFSADRQYFGEVRDLMTGNAVPGVAVLCADSRQEEGRTDSAGRFSTGSSVLLSHPNYGEGKYYLDSCTNMTCPKILWLVPRASACFTVAHHNGTLATNVEVRVALVSNDLFSNVSDDLFSKTQQVNTTMPDGYPHVELKGMTDHNGQVLFTNVPARLGSLYAEVWAPNRWRPLDRSEEFTVQPGTHTDVGVILPPIAALAVRFVPPVDLDVVSIKCTRDQDVIVDPHEFVQGDNAFLLPQTTTGMYTLSVYGEGVATVSTTLFLRGDQETEVMVETNPDKSGAITGTVSDQLGTPLLFKACARITNNADVVASDETDSLYRADDARPFVLAGLDPHILYDVTVSSGDTNVVVRSVRPNGPPLAVTIRAYRITANIVTREGKPVEAYVDLRSAQSGFGTEYQGEMTLYPITPGIYLLEFAGYAPDGSAGTIPRIVREVTVVDRDIDLGDIVVDDPGVTVQGKLVDADGQPVQGCWVTLQSNDSNTYQLAGFSDSKQTHADGSFTLTNVVRNESLTLIAEAQEFCATKQVGALDSDTDLGTIQVMRRPWLEVRFVDQYGAPVTNVYVCATDDRLTDERGIWTGEAPRRLGRLIVSAKPPEQRNSRTDYHTATYPVTDEPTNHITVTLPAGFGR